VQSQYKAYKEEPDKEYRLVSAWDHYHPILAEGLTIGKCRIHFRDRGQEVEYWNIFRESQDYLTSTPQDREWFNVIVHVEAKCPVQAAERGIEALDTARGLLNFHLNKNKWRSLTLIGRPRRVNAVVGSPVHVLYYRTCDGQQSRTWVEPDYVDEPQRKLAEDDLKKASSAAQSSIQCLSSHPLSGNLVPAIAYYCRALDKSDLEDAFQRLWRVLEMLLTEGNRNQTAELISRAASMWSDKDWNRAIVRHLSIRRNHIVHRNIEFSDQEWLLYQAMPFVHGSIDFMLHGTHGQTSLKGVHALLDQRARQSDVAGSTSSKDTEPERTRGALELPAGRNKKARKERSDGLE
jgi:hypothetical protein